MSGPKHLEFQENEAANARLQQAQRQLRCDDLRTQIADIVKAAQADLPQVTGLGASFWKQQLHAAKSEQDESVLQRQLHSLQHQLMKAREHAMQVRERVLQCQLESDAWRLWATATQQQQREILANLDALRKLQQTEQRAELLASLERQMATWQRQAAVLQDQQTRRELVVGALSQALAELGANLVISDEHLNAYRQDPSLPLEVAAFYPDGGEERLNLPLSLEGVVRTPDSRTDNHEYILQLQQLLRENAGIELNFKSVHDTDRGPDRDRTAKPLPGALGQQHQQNRGG